MKSKDSHVINLKGKDVKRPLLLPSIGIQFPAEFRIHWYREGVKRRDFIKGLLGIAWVSQGN